MPPKTKKTKTVVVKEPEIPEIETLAILEEKPESDDEIQAPPPSTPKPKKVLTEKQKEAFAKGREICHARRMVKDLTEKKREALIERQKLIDEKKKIVEDKLIATAVAIKKKQLLEEARLAKYTKDIQEEIPDEVIRKIIKEKKVPSPPILQREQEPIRQNYPQYYFV
jgi:hypothetical protein